LWEKRTEKFQGGEAAAICEHFSAVCNPEKKQRGDRAV
jgi:hypothetical protein